MLQVHILTVFPDMFKHTFGESMLKRAQEAGITKLQVHNLRDWTDDPHQSTDDRPFGGGAGMVMMIEPIYRALQDIKKQTGDNEPYVIVTAAKGEQFTQAAARMLTAKKTIVIICGHYEGIDERVYEHLADAEYSVGPYVLTGGELPAMIITDAVVRLLPGVLGNQDSLNQESYDEEGFKEAPHYTRPAEFTTATGEIWKVPDVLLSGNHEEIRKWRAQKSTKSHSQQ